MIIQGDALEELKKLDSESVDMCCTSPPYFNQRDYCVPGQIGREATIEEYVDKLCNVFDEVKRVLKPTGSFYLNLGDSYYTSHQPGNIDNKNSKTAKLKNTYKGRAGVKTISRKCQLLIPHRVAIELINRGWIARNTIIWEKRNAMPEPVKDRFTTNYEYLFFFVKNLKYYFNQQFEPLKQTTIERYERGVSGRHKYKNGVPGQNKQELFKERRRTEYDKRGANKRCVWKIATKPSSESHFACYPEELLQTPIKACLPPKGILLDPFAGSGTTAAAQKRWQPSAKTILIELNAEYIKIIKKRLDQGVLGLA